jgi:hypothetical protein
MEVKRQLDVLDRRLAENEFIAGDTYTIADMAIFPWYGGLAKGWQYGAADFLSVQDYKNVQRWADMLLERPAVRRGRMVNRVSGEPSTRPSCANATTPAISRPGRKTSSRLPTERIERGGRALSRTDCHEAASASESVVFSCSQKHRETARESVDIGCLCP